MFSGRHGCVWSWGAGCWSCVWWDIVAANTHTGQNQKLIRRPDTSCALSTQISESQGFPQDVMCRCWYVEMRRWRILSNCGLRILKVDLPKPWIYIISCHSEFQPGRHGHRKNLKKFHLYLHEFIITVIINVKYNLFILMNICIWFQVLTAYINITLTKLLKILNLKITLLMT